MLWLYPTLILQESYPYAFSLHHSWLCSSDMTVVYDSGSVEYPDTQFLFIWHEIRGIFKTVHIMADMVHHWN